MVGVTIAEVTPATTVPAAREAGAAPAPDTRRRSPTLILRYALFAAGAALLCIGILIYWLSGGRYVDSTDTDLLANELDVSTDVAGLVQVIRVHEGQAVQQDQVLFTLDPLPFQLMVDAALAQLAQSRLDMAALQSDYVRGQRQVAMQLAQVDADQATFSRYAALVGTHAVAREAYDDARFKLLADVWCGTVRPSRDRSGTGRCLQK
jgi:membrane fusion protein (multidrug efflux system)